MCVIRRTVGGEMQAFPDHAHAARVSVVLCDADCPLPGDATTAASPTSTGA
jgi:hypothetical protein